MESLPYDYKPVASIGWGAAAVAVAATTLLGLDFADLGNPFGDDSAGRVTYSAIVAAGATIQPTEPTSLLQIEEQMPPAKVVALLDERAKP
jgi:hypothetical protein